RTDYIQAFDKLKEYQTSIKDWLFGYLTYDLKNDIEDLSSKNFDALELPDLYFFQPKKLFIIKKDILELHYLVMVEDEIKQDFQDIESLDIQGQDETQTIPLRIKLRMQKDQYFEHLDQI